MTRRRIIFLSGMAVLVAAYLCCLPRDLFKGVPCSTVVEDAGGNLLGARIAADGQWRFPPCDSIPKRYETALIQFEDRHFRYHPGIDPGAIARALVQNIRAGKVESGGSTLTMQVIRLSRGRERTLWQKAVEAVLATRLELRCTKDEILALYASYAPFGGNVVGLEAAAWRYFGRPAEELSWGEAATLAVLPNAPSSIHPGKRREALLEKRNRLLKRLMEHGDIDETSYELACEEPLPDAPHPLPSHAPHLVAQAPEGVRTRTAVRLDLQQAVETVTNRWSDELDRSGIADLAAVIFDLRTREPVAYIGNASPLRERPGSQVDILRAPRSTGSILKPFLYAAALQEGTILPRTLLPDIPVNINGFSPQNFDLQFYGAVPAAEALARSLNVPAVHLLRAYGVPEFHALLRRCGMTTLTHDAGHYGLSLILGGGEGTLYEITSIYASLARTYLGMQQEFPLNDKVALWHTLEALKAVNRPDEIDWRLITSVRKAAWKTGTSYGFRDAWAVGVTPDWAVGVWVGTALGQGVPGLTGAKTAGPVLFELLGLLPAGTDWFPEPDPAEGVMAEVCPASGHLKGLYCDASERVLLPKNALRSEPCPYHREIGGVSAFVLPPAMEWYYKPHHPEYKTPVQTPDALAFIYPEQGSTVYLPRQLDGSVPGIIMQVAHRDPAATLWWHLDDGYLGETKFVHKMSVKPDPGPHTATVVDAEGRTVSVRFTVSE